MKSMKSVLSAVVLALMVVGCSQGAGVSESKPIQEVKAEAQKMDATQLESMVKKYEAAIQAKKADADKLQAKLKEIPLKELLGDEAKKLKTEVSEFSTSLNNLAERMAVYADTLKDKAKQLN